MPLNTRKAKIYLCRSDPDFVGLSSAQLSSAQLSSGGNPFSVRLTVEFA